MASTPPSQPSSSGAGSQPGPGARRPAGPRVVHVSGDRVRVEFQVEDLVNRLLQDIARQGGTQVASCGGCNGCSGSRA